MEIIRRNGGSEKVNLLEEFSKVQYSFNSYGHLAIRLFEPKKNEEKKAKQTKLMENKDRDIIIVFTAGQTSELKHFLDTIKTESYRGYI